ncbi:MAG: radical SAM family heme chaperone HemW [Oscillospiraceae bacterium]|nr:radical SAM family heme chaperone HemW [Oscillospiraceae bacterium]
MQVGIYIHIPFCRKKCPYCDFYSVTTNEILMDKYTQTVLCELAKYKGKITASSVYFGGGTPYLMGAERLGKILGGVKKIGLAKDCEVTIEANPCDVTQGELTQLVKLGFNRISFGVQSLVDSELATLGRRHDAKGAISAIELAKSAGFDNISADLMIATPNQTKHSLLQSIDALAKLPINHVSAYLLKIEQGTPFYANGVSALCPNEDQTADMYLFAVEKLAKRGFEQYEISNFAKDGKISVHNTSYWECKQYLGIGSSAHGYYGGVRYSHSRDINRYIESNANDIEITDNAPGTPSEKLMLLLRLTKGVDIPQFESEFSLSLNKVVEKAKFFEKHGLIRVENGKIALTPNGFLLSNSIISELTLLI